MKAVFAGAVALLVAAVYAAPPADTLKRDNTFSVIFQGAPPDAAYFPQTFSLETVETISNPLSISHIVFPGGGYCTFYGIDGSVTVVGPGAETVDVGPPQTQVSGFCQGL